MRRKIRNQLIVAIIVALIIVVIAWRSRTRPSYLRVATLTDISYQPPSATNRDPYLVYTFSQPLPADAIRGTSAVLKGFSVSAASPTSGPAADAFLSQLMNGVPFVPGSPTGVAGTELTTATVPASMPTSPITVTGTGVMWFVSPNAKKGTMVAIATAATVAIAATAAMAAIEPSPPFA